jgi:hypothetical protein
MIGVKCSPRKNRVYRQTFGVRSKPFSFKNDHIELPVRTAATATDVIQFPAKVQAGSTSKAETTTVNDENRKPSNAICSESSNPTCIKSSRTSLDAAKAGSSYGVHLYHL